MKDSLTAPEPRSVLISTEADRFTAAVAEGRMIVSRHDGMHLLHSDLQALVFAGNCGTPADYADADRILARMRRADRSGVYRRPEAEMA